MRHLPDLLLLCFLLIAVSCTNQSENVKYDRYRVAGERLYAQRCANCHQLDGEGLRGLYPPLKDADFVVENLAGTLCIIKNGRREPMVVNGITYDMAMPASGLTNLEIAEIATYIYNEWGYDRGLIDVKKVDSIARKCD